MATIVKSTASPAEIPLFLGAPQPTKSPTSLLADLRGFLVEFDVHAIPFGDDHWRQALLLTIAWLVPKEQVPEGIWLVGVGIILLGLNAARYFNGIKMSNFTIGLGILALLVGIASFAGVDLPLLPIVLILIGADIIFKIVTRQPEQK